MNEVPSPKTTRSSLQVQPWWSQRVGSSQRPAAAVAPRQGKSTPVAPEELPTRLPHFSRFHGSLSAALPLRPSVTSVPRGPSPAPGPRLALTRPPLPASGWPPGRARPAGRLAVAAPELRHQANGLTATRPPQMTGSTYVLDDQDLEYHIDLLR